MKDPVIATELATQRAPEPHPEDLSASPVTPFRAMASRFCHHPLALVGVAILIVLFVLALLAPYIVPDALNPNTNDPTAMLNNLNQVNASPSTTPSGWFILGADSNGHSVLAMILWGSRLSLLIGFASAIFSTIIGILVGAIAGYYGGILDTVMMRITDVFLCLPFLPMVILAASIFGADHPFVIIAVFVIFYWPYVARLARASYLSLRTQEFTEAARAVGVGDFRIIFRHILPSSLRPIIVQSTLSIANFITLEATIDYLGAGLSIKNPSWGNILSDAQSALSNNGNWWWATFPGIVLTLTVLAVNFVGDGLGDALDVRSKG